MPPNTFYGKRPSRENQHFVTVCEACESASMYGSWVWNIVVFPLESSDQDVESDVGDASSIMSSDEEAFELARELDVDDTDDSEDGLEPPTK